MRVFDAQTAKLTMAGLDPATQQASVTSAEESLRRADARRLGGRVKPGHGGREEAAASPAMVK